MKKSLISLAILATVSAANAVEFGVGYTRDITNEINGYGVSVTQSWKKWSLGAQADRFEVVGGNQDQFTVVAGHEIAKVHKLVIDAHAGATYIQSEVGKDGLVPVAGLSVSYPIIKNMSIAADVRRAIRIEDLKQYEGTSLGVGIKYKF
jgi:hypothetical protein